jgi:UrcA family protein
MKSSVVKSIAALFAALCISSAADTFAQDRGSPSDSEWGIRIHLGGLDLSKPRDVALLYGRISRAAHDVCGSSTSFDGRVWLVDECVERTIEDVVNRIHKPQLTALRQTHKHPAAG